MTQGWRELEIRHGDALMSFAQNSLVGLIMPAVTSPTNRFLSY